MSNVCLDFARLRRAALVAAVALVATMIGARQPLRAQESPPESPLQHFDEEDDDRDLPFNTDQLFVPRWRLTDGPQVRAAFRNVVIRASEATVAIHCDGKHRGWGGIIGADGWVLTKATPLCGEVTCVMADGRELKGATVGANRQYDLALVKVEASDLPTLDLSDSTVPAVGSWLASIGSGRDPVAVGVVSVGPREIPPQPGRLGVLLDDNNEPVVVDVLPEGGAAAAGMKSQDRVLSVAGQPTPTGAELRRVIASFNPGDEVELVILREGQRLTLKATLSGSFPGIPMGRSEFQNSLGGRLSVRRFGFPVAIQHDTVLRPVDCGGPVVDLDGRVVGFNIARAGRTESYAIPVAAVREVVGELMTAGLAATANVETAIVPDEDEDSDDASDEATSGADASPYVPAAQAAAAYRDEGYELAWSDEFELDGRPDPSKWTYERGFVRNEELQWYRPDNARCQGGSLVIEARRENVSNPRFDPTSAHWQDRRERANYTSASLLTRGLASWQYGRFEMRGRIDVRSGMWPAFWTLGEDGPWPVGGEIDVMEYYRKTLLANAAWAKDEHHPEWDDSRTSLAELGGKTWADQFHVWRMDWDKNSIKLSVDGRLLNEVALSKTINKTPDGKNPFRQPHYMLLNLAIGGTNGGDPSGTEFPARFEVDYVRVYQK